VSTKTLPLKSAIDAIFSIKKLALSDILLLKH
jgi:hypothetical protein